MKILVINCGSSSLKYQLINPETEEVFAKGLCERIGIDGSKMEYEVVAKDFEKIGNSYAKSQRSIRISNISFN